MSQASAEGRLALKTPEAAFLRVLTEEFGFSSRVSRELLQVGQEMLAGGGVSLGRPARPGAAGGDQLSGSVWAAVATVADLNKADDQGLCGLDQPVDHTLN